MYKKELCKFRWRIAMVHLPCMHRTLGSAPALQQMCVAFQAAYLNHCPHYNSPPPVLPHLSRKQGGPGPHGPIPAQSYVLVCNMSMVVTSQDCCQMKQCFQKALGPLRSLVPTAARFLCRRLLPSRLGKGLVAGPAHSAFSVALVPACPVDGSWCPVG